ncbi:putative ankyrin repeat protein [Cotonvirus japonicus]|uniref:Ankyrin repeat protein n=1 Tax=Cotonvirus japonicus TaxID=2811091 RepID=A0ABM7NUC4_9VIRU|nr:putative ankyrin repeat protein [Cotonvirus japonicus]BCS83729.1 putative ankyrin repeat protein [Cotonvirus japonicus]
MKKCVIKSAKKTQKNENKIMEDEKKYSITPKLTYKKSDLSKLMRMVLKENKTSCGHQKIIEFLSNKNRDMYYFRRGEFRLGWNVLMIAVAGVNNFCSLKTIELLLKYGGNNYINSQDNNGRTALMIATDHSLNIGIEIAEFLLKNGADTNIQDCMGFSALYFACANPDITDPNIIPLLLKYGANVNLLSKKKNSPIIYFFKKYKDKPEFHNIKNLLLKNLDHKILPNIKINNYSCKIFQYFIDDGININIPNEKGNTCLINACKYGNKKIVEFLINNGSDPMLENKKGRNCYIIASKNNNFNIVKLLFNYGYDYLSCNNRKNIFYYLGYNVFDFLKLHDQKQFAKQNMKRVLFEIHSVAANFTLSPTSINTQLLDLNWSIKNNETDSLFDVKNKKILDYFGIYDEESLLVKVNSHLDFNNDL